MPCLFRLRLRNEALLKWQELKGVSAGEVDLFEAAIRVKNIALTTQKGHVCTSGQYVL